jgi:hypothetical protein
MFDSLSPVFSLPVTSFHFSPVAQKIVALPHPQTLEVWTAGLRPE